MKVRIKGKKEIAKDTLLVEFDLLGQKVNFQAGQYFFITLSKLKYDDARGSSRHFSIVNSPHEKGILALATRIRDSAFKQTLNELPVGSEVEAGSIAGSFTLPQDFSRPLVFIAGGIGITPYISILRFVKEESLPYKITLIYSNRDKASTAFYEELTQFSKIIPDFKLVLTMTDDLSWQGEKRRIDAQFIRDYTKDLDNPLFYTVGPPQMNEVVIEALKKLGVEEFEINTENFSGY